MNPLTIGQAGQGEVPVEPCASNLDLKRLRDMGEAVLDPSGVEGLLVIILRELEVFWENVWHAVIRWGGADLFKLAVACGQGSPYPSTGELGRIAFDLRFADCGEVVRVEVSGRGVVRVGSPAHAERVEKWLARVGLKAGQKLAVLALVLVVVCAGSATADVDDGDGDDGDDEEEQRCEELGAARGGSEGGVSRYVRKVRPRRACGGWRRRKRGGVAGVAKRAGKSRQGKFSAVPGGTRLRAWRTLPTDKSVGYCRSSLRDCFRWSRRDSPTWRTDKSVGCFSSPLEDLEAYAT